MDIFILILIIIAAYLLGSIPSAVLVGKKMYGIDVREHGSHNAGATNTMRVLGRRAGLLVFLMDGIKGYAAVMLGWLAPLDPDSEMLVIFRLILVIVAVLGHIFPVFAGFRGGKGVATATGCLLALTPMPILMCFAVFTIVFFATNYVSLGSMSGGILYPVFVYFVWGDHSPTMLVFSILVAVMLVFTHRNNIRRLRAGAESKTYIFRKKDKKESE